MTIVSNVSVEDKYIGLSSQLQETSGCLEKWSKRGAHSIVLSLAWSSPRFLVFRILVVGWPGPWCDLEQFEATDPWQSRSRRRMAASGVLSCHAQNWKRHPQRVLQLFIWPIFERSVSGPGWKTALNCRVSISDTLQFFFLFFTFLGYLSYDKLMGNFLYILAGALRNVEFVFLTWKVEWRALTMTLAIRRLSWLGNGRLLRWGVGIVSTLKYLYCKTKSDSVLLVTIILNIKLMASIGNNVCNIVPIHSNQPKVMRDHLLNFRA